MKERVISLSLEFASKKLKEAKFVEREFRHENFKNPNLNFKKFEFFYGNKCTFPIKRFHLRNREKKNEERKVTSIAFDCQKK